jgi:nitrate reductase molybdenum cofactor assembly chaperone NarJ/NarW
MKLRTRTRPDTLRDRLVWQCASVMLSYPDLDRFDIVDGLLALSMAMSRICWGARHPR